MGQTKEKSTATDISSSRGDHYKKNFNIRFRTRLRHSIRTPDFNIGFAPDFNIRTVQTTLVRPPLPPKRQHVSGYQRFAKQLG